MKKCKQCGMIRENTEFRKNYYGQGTCNTCYQCESINSRWKYLSRKGSLKPEELTELESIEALYEKQRAMGLKPPKRRSSTAAQSMLAEYNALAMHWLKAELTMPPEYYLDRVYETLLGADDKLRAAVLDRFYQYEDECYHKKQEEAK